MFFVAFGRDFPDHIEAPRDSVMRCENFAEVDKVRKVTGDLVFDAETLEIVLSDDWLWEAEKNDETCYAPRAQRNKITLKIIE